MDRTSREAFQGVAIDLANTLDVHGDVLDDPGWAVRLGDRQPGGPGPLGGLREDDGRRLVELRAAVRDLLGAGSTADTRRPPRSRRSTPPRPWPPGIPSSTGPWAAPGGRWTERSGTIGDAVLAAVARSTIELLAGEDGERLRRCSAPGCPRFFVARDARRVWCDSRTCGNRVRVARHAARRRAAMIYRLR